MGSPVAQMQHTAAERCSSSFELDPESSGRHGVPPPTIDRIDERCHSSTSPASHCDAARRVRPRGDRGRHFLQPPYVLGIKVRSILVRALPTDSSVLER